MFDQGSASKAAGRSSRKTYSIEKDEAFSIYFLKEFNNLLSSQQHVSTYIPIDPSVLYSDKQLEQELQAPYYSRNQKDHPIVEIIIGFFKARNDLFSDIATTLATTTLQERIDFNEKDFKEITKRLNQGANRQEQLNIFIDNILGEQVDYVFADDDPQKEVIKEQLERLRKYLNNPSSSIIESNDNTLQSLGIDPLSEIAQSITIIMKGIREKETHNKIWEAGRVVVTCKMQDYNIGAGNTFGYPLGIKSATAEQQQAGGSQLARRIISEEESKPKRELEDNIINHARAGVEYLIAQLQNLTLIPNQPPLPTESTGLQTNNNNNNADPANSPKLVVEPIMVDRNQLAANYPCLVIRLNDGYEHHITMKANNVLNEYDKAYPEFLTHLLIAYINKELYDKRLGGYFDRRQSFGFLTPTATDVGSSIRLNLGLIPSKGWLDCVATGIKNFNASLKTLWDNPHEETTKIILGKPGKMGNPQAKFNKGHIQGYGHHLFLRELITSNTVNNTIQQISSDKRRAKDKKKVQETVARIKSLRDDLKKIDYNSDLPMAEDDQFAPHFEELYAKLNQLYSNPEEASEDNENIKSIRDKIRELQQKIDQYRDRSIKEIEEKSEIEVTSESGSGGEPTTKDSSQLSADETEVSTNISQLGKRKERVAALEPATIGSRKYLSATGMSALFIPLLAYHDTFKGGDPITCKTEPYCYFELADWKNDKLVKKAIKFVDNDGTPDIVFFDNNPCVNGAEEPLSVKDIFTNDQNKAVQMIVADVTCATQAEKVTIRERWESSGVPFLVFAESGLKYRQFGLDLAQYGENRLYISEKYKKEHVEQAEALEARFNYYTQAQSTPYATSVIRELRIRAQEQEESILPDYIEELLLDICKDDNDDIKQRIRRRLRKLPVKEMVTREKIIAYKSEYVSAPTAVITDEIEPMDVEDTAALERTNRKRAAAEEITNKNMTKIRKVEQANPATVTASLSTQYSQWYDDSTIFTLLNNFTHGDTIKIVSPTAYIVGFSDAVRPLIDDDTTTTIVVPINVNVVSRTSKTGENNHWIGLVIDLNKQGVRAVQKIRYIDPLGLPIADEVAQQVREEMELANNFPIEVVFDNSQQHCPQYGRIETTPDNSYYLSDESNCNDCGPFLVEALIRIAQNRDVSDMTRDNLSDSKEYGMQLRKDQEGVLLSLGAQPSSTSALQPQQLIPGQYAIHVAKRLVDQYVLDQEEKDYTKLLPILNGYNEAELDELQNECRSQLGQNKTSLDGLVLFIIGALHQIKGAGKKDHIYDDDEEPPPGSAPAVPSGKRASSVAAESSDNSYQQEGPSKSLAPSSITSAVTAQSKQQLSKSASDKSLTEQKLPPADEIPTVASKSLTELIGPHHFYTGRLRRFLEQIPIAVRAQVDLEMGKRYEEIMAGKMPLGEVENTINAMAAALQQQQPKKGYPQELQSQAPRLFSQQEKMILGFIMGHMQKDTVPNQKAAEEIIAQAIEPFEGSDEKLQEFMGLFILKKHELVGKDNDIDLSNLPRIISSISAQMSQQTPHQQLSKQQQQRDEIVPKNLEAGSPSTSSIEISI